MSPSPVTRIEMHHWTHLCPMCCTSPSARVEGWKGLIYENCNGGWGGGERRALASYAILLTLNQYLSESMDALKSKFQGKIFSAALRKGLVRL